MYAKCNLSTECARHAAKRSQSERDARRRAHRTHPPTTPPTTTSSHMHITSVHSTLSDAKEQLCVCEVLCSTAQHGGELTSLPSTQPQNVQPNPNSSKKSQALKKVKHFNFGAVFDFLPDSFACDPPHGVESALIELTLRTATLGNRRLTRPAPCHRGEYANTRCSPPVR